MVGSGRAGTLSAPARRAAAGFASLLRAFAGGGDRGDRLWTPEPVAFDRLTAVAGLPRPELVSGPLERVPVVPGQAVLAWGETPAVAALRRRAGAVTEPPPAGVPPWLASLLRMPQADPASAARANDRRFCLEVAGSLGVAFNGARCVQSADELAGHVRGEAFAIGGGAWVAKAPWSAAGRHRVIASGAEDPGDPAIRRRLERLLARFGALVVDPWVRRTEDYGAVGLVSADGRVASLGTHRLEVDRRGAFSGLLLGGVGEEVARRLEATSVEVGRRLARAGYVGPFGIDGFTWSDPSGGRHLHPLAEINARVTFGLLARALAERVVPTEWRGSVALRLGRPIPPVGGEGGGGKEPRRIELLAATAESPGAWLGVGPAASAERP